MKTMYVVNYKETTIDENAILDVDCGTCEVGYTEESEAIKKCWELSDDKLNEHLGDLDSDTENIYRDTNENGDYQCVHCHSDTYEYWVTKVVVE